MGCTNCGVNKKKGPNGKPMGCRGNGGCTSGGCNRLNVFDWLSDLPFSAQQSDCRIVEVSFKNGSRKGFYRNTHNIDCHTGDLIVVESPQGHDTGTISLSGELVRLQMQKKKVKDDDQILRIIRVANEYDVQRLKEVKQQEYSTMLLARVLAHRLGLDMKIGDVEYQGDGRKATFYYTADNRVDFRELIKVYAREFRVKIEMRQIGARQEASRIGGIGSCGRELCCSTWLTSFKSVSTTAARYQNLAINQSKLSGQCGRLKCCLNYELDTYLDALQDFPKNADHLALKKGTARLIKTDIFKRKMWYSPVGASGTYALSVAHVKEILEMNARGEQPDSLAAWVILEKEVELSSIGLEEEGLKDIGDATLAELEKDREKRRKRKRNKRRTRSQDNSSFQRDAKAKHGSSTKEIKRPKPPTTKEGKRQAPTLIKPKSSGNRSSRSKPNSGLTAKQEKTSQNQKPRSTRQKEGDKKRATPQQGGKHKVSQGGNKTKQQQTHKLPNAKREGEGRENRMKTNTNKTRTISKPNKTSTGKNKPNTPKKTNPNKTTSPPKEAGKPMAKKNQNHSKTGNKRKQPPSSPPKKGGE